MYKGVIAGEEVEMTFQPADGRNCGISFKSGAQQLVYGYLAQSKGDPNQLSAGGGCSQGSLREPHLYHPTMDAYRYAIANATESVKRNPRSTAAWEALAGIQERHRDYLALRKTLPEIEALLPQEPGVKERKGSVFAELGQWDRALAEYQRALDIAPERERARRGKDQALLKLGRAAETDPTRLDFSNMEFPKADFAKRDLRKARFAGTKLIDADFSGAHLAGVDFEKATFGKANFHGADLTGARFVGMRSNQIDFSRSKLSGINFENAALGRPKFIDTDLTGSRFRGSQSYQADFSGSVLRGADFSGATLRFARFDKADLRDADFRRASLEDATITNTRLVDTKISEANLYHADLSGSDLSGLDLSSMQMQGIALRDAILVNANLRGALLAGPIGQARNNERLHGPGRAADLRGADLTGAQLDGADMRYALFDCKTKWPPKIDPAREIFIPVSSARCPGTPIRTALFR
jgi:uncharacterized protein YjbI with pentapeptide repeats